VSPGRMLILDTRIIYLGPEFTVGRGLPWGWASPGKRDDRITC